MTPEKLVLETLSEAAKPRLKRLTAKSAYYHAFYNLGGPFPAGEKTIAKSGAWAYLYARNILKGPFPAGEEAIAKNKHWACMYAKEVLKGQFPAGEKVIMGSEYEQDYIWILTQPPEL